MELSGDTLPVSETRDASLTMYMLVGVGWVGFLSSFFHSFYMLSATELHTCIFMYK